MVKDMESAWNHQQERKSDNERRIREAMSLYGDSYSEAAERVMRENDYMSYGSVKN